MADPTKGAGSGDQDKSKDLETQETSAPPAPAKVKVKVNEAMARNGQSIYDPEQKDAKARNIGKEPVTVEETSLVQEMLLKKQLVRA